MNENTGRTSDWYDSKWRLCSEFLAHGRQPFLYKFAIVLASCSDNPLAIDELSVRSPVRPTELPHIRPRLRLTISEQFTVGLRSAFVASYYAAPLLIAADVALVVNVSFYGAVSYHLDPAYGATKAGLDKLTFDMAQDFKPYKVAVVSIWPGPTATERSKSILAKMPGGNKTIESAETPKFSGLAIASLYSDPQLLSKSGSVIIAAEAALEYGFKDFNGKQPPSLREQRGSPRPFFTKS